VSRIQSLVASHLTRNWTTIPHVTRHDDADIEALDTPNGLLAPVIRDADQKSIEQIAEEITALSQQARSRGLPLDRMTGGCFTLS
jgi:pyruvate/2-oxoglutarate dehydrogenase complex dihydrolipoamide acyltransferase (E2) component